MLTPSKSNPLFIVLKRLHGINNLSEYQTCSSTPSDTKRRRAAKKFIKDVNKYSLEGCKKFYKRCI